MTEGTTRASLLTRGAATFGVVFFMLGFSVHAATRFADFRVLHLGGELARAARWTDAYDTEAFGAIARSRPEMAASHRELDVFLSTPTFGWAMWPFSSLSAQTALIAWIVVGIAAVAIATRILALPLWVVAISLVMPFGVANLHHGQTGFFAILLAAGVHALCVRERKVLAGLAAGLVVLKPTLLLGVAIWWLVDWRRWYPALLAAIPSALLLALPGLVRDGLEPWRLFAESSSNRVDVQVDVVANQPTIRELSKRLLGGEVGAHPAMQLAILAAGFATLLAIRKRFADRTDVLSGSAIFVSILVSPHLYVYDSGLVLIPLAVLVHHNVQPWVTERLVAVYATSSLLTIMSLGFFGTLNDWVAPGTIGMLAMFALWIRAMRGTDRSSATVAQRSIPSSVPQVNVTSS